MHKVDLYGSGNSFATFTSVQFLFLSFANLFFYSKFYYAKQENVKA